MKLKTTATIIAASAFLLGSTATIPALDASYFSQLSKTEFTIEDQNFSVPTLDRHDVVQPIPQEIKLSESEAKKLQAESGGKTRGAKALQKYDVYGKPISPDTLMYRSMLSDRDKEAYDEIFNNILSFNSSFSVQVDSYSNLHNIVRSVYYDNPELFWWDGMYYYSTSRIFQSYNITIFYLFDKESIKSAVKDFHSKSFPILFYASLLETDQEKIKYVHDYICKSARYNHAAVANNQSGGLNQTAYSAIVDYNTVCAGYAKAYAYYLQKLGIPCSYIFSSTHAWNLVKIDNNYYQTDVCWDDSDWGWDTSYSYYLKSNSDMYKIDHHQTTALSSDLVSHYKTKGSSYKFDSSYFSWRNTYNFSELNNFLTDIEAPEYIDFGIAKKTSRKPSSTIKLNCSLNEKNGGSLDKVLQNQRVEIHVKPNKNCYLAVLLIDAKGNKAWLDTKNNFVKANTEKIFPDKHSYELVVNSDMTGNERIIIYASSDEIGLPQVIDSNNFSENDLYIIMNNLKNSLSQNPAATGQETISYTVVDED